MPNIRLIFLFLATLLLSGCLDIETLVRVRPDGSGQIEERFLMGAQLSALGAMQEEQSGQGGKSQLFDRTELEKRAHQMGPGVTLASVEPLTVGERQGYHAIFSFTDISKVRLNQNPGDHAPAGGGMQGEGPVEELMTFEFHPGSPAELVIHSGMKGNAEGTSAQGGAMPAGDDANAEMALGMMREMFKEMRIAIAVEVEGQIIDTNATHRDGSRITLTEMDFGKLLENPERFKKFAQANPQTLEESKKLLKGLEGFKIEFEPNVRVRFSEGGVIEAKQGSQPSPATTATTGGKAPVGKTGWSEVAPVDAVHYQNDLVEVTAHDGTRQKGMLVSAADRRLRLRIAELDGGGEVDFALSEVEELRVFSPGN